MARIRLVWAIYCADSDIQSARTPEQLPRRLDQLRIRDLAQMQTSVQSYDSSVGCVGPHLSEVDATATRSSGKKLRCAPECDTAAGRFVMCAEDGPTGIDGTRRR